MSPVDPLAPAATYPVLVVHNAYQQRGGEDAVVAAEVDLLRRHGHTVHTYFRHNDEVKGSSRAALAAGTLWSRSAYRDVAELIRKHQPRVMHVHNTLPLISPAVYWAAARAGVPVVQTLHNFRLVCPQALMLREQRVCEDCVGRIPWRAVVHSCYRESAVQSAVVAGMLQTHRWLGTWRTRVARYVALNDFCRQQFIAGGLPAERIRVKPNFVDLPPPPEGPRQGLLYVGRLSVEKGIGTLAQAMQRTSGGSTLRVAGTGPLEGQLDGLARVERLGALEASAVTAHMRQAAALVVPSIWYENFPRTIVEAYACGLPVIASRIGALATLVADGKTGLLFEPGNADDLARVIDWAISHPDRMLEMGRLARQHYESHLTPDANYRLLRSIYEEARFMQASAVAST